MAFVGPYQIYKIDGGVTVARVADWDKLAVSVGNGLAVAESNAKTYADAGLAADRSRMGTIEATNADQASAITAVKAKNTDQDARITDVETLAGLAPGDVSDATVRNLVGNPATNASKEFAKQYPKRGEQRISVTDYGAKGDWVSGTGTGTDNLVPFQQAYAAALASNRSLYIPDGKYRFSNEWDIWRINSAAKPISIIGESRENTWLVSDFFGAEKSLVKNYDPANVNRSSPTSFANLQFRSVSRSGGVNPVYLNNGAWSESTVDHLKWGPSNNTQFRGSSLQNIRINDTVFYYGGKNFLYKSTDGITFTVLAATGVITASASVFTASDVGMLFFLSPANETTRIMYKIASVTDSTHAVIDLVATPAIDATIPSKGNFDAALATIASGSTTLTANAPCFTATDVGRVLYIRNARQGAYGAGILRATITGFTDASTVTLDVPATLAVTKTPFAMPVVDIFTPDTGGLLGATNTDIKWNNLHMEAYTGLGLGIIAGLQFHINDQKIHGEHDPVDTRMSTGMAWLDDFGGVFSGEFDGGSTSDVRLHCSNMNDLLKIPYLSTRRVRNEPLFQVENVTEKGAMVEINTLVVYRHDDAGAEKFIIDKALAAGNSPKITYNGMVAMVGGTVDTRMYVGRGTYFTTAGRLVSDNTGFLAGFDASFVGPNGARVLFEDIGTKKYSMGNVAGGGSTFNLFDESTGLIRWQVNNAGDFTPGSNGTQRLGSVANKWSEIYGDKQFLGSTLISRTSGTGSPEGVVTAPIGSEYINTAGTAGTIKYGKKTGTGNTGWVAIW